MTDSEQPAPTRWSEVFRRSTISPVVFNVRKESTEAVVEALRTASLRRVTHRTTLGSPASSGDEAYAATAILDGYVVELLKRWGLPVGDSLRSGMRVVGTDPMRLLSLLLELQPPTRSLKGEERVPATKDLLTGLAEQTRQSDAQLDSAAERGIGIRDASELLKLVIDLYGEAAVPNPPNALLAKLPGEGEWGEAGFNRFQQKRFESELIQVSDATKWRDIGFDFIEIIGAKGLAIEQGRRFRELGYRPYQVLRMLEQSIPVSEPEAMVVAGFTRDLAAEAAIHSYSVEEVKTFVEAQMHEVRSFRDILRVGLPIELAKEWLDLGFEPMVIGRLVRFGWTPSAAVEALGPIPREQRSRAAWNLDRLST